MSLFEEQLTVRINAAGGVEKVQDKNGKITDRECMVLMRHVNQLEVVIEADEDEIQDQQKSQREYLLMAFHAFMRYLPTHSLSLLSSFLCSNIRPPGPAGSEPPDSRLHYRQRSYSMGTQIFLLCTTISTQRVDLHIYEFNHMTRSTLRAKSKIFTVRVGSRLEAC